MSVLKKFYPATPDYPRILAVYTDRVILGNFIKGCPAGLTFEDATVFRPGYKGAKKENMVITCRNEQGQVEELHIEVE